MRQKTERNAWFLIAGITAISGIGWLIHTFAPTRWYLIVVFYLLVFLAIAATFLFILNNVRRSLLLGCGGALFLILRQLELRSIFYVLLLIALLLSLELYLRKR